MVHGNCILFRLHISAVHIPENKHRVCVNFPTRLGFLGVHLTLLKRQLEHAMVFSRRYVVLIPKKKIFGQQCILYVI